MASTPALLDHASTLHPPREALVGALDSLAAAGGPVHAEAGFWTAIASAEDVLDANRVLLDRHSHAVDRHVPPDETLRGRVEFGESTVVQRGAVAQGPVVLGRDVTVAEGARVGPCTSVGDGCTTTGASVESSVVLDDVSIRANERVVDSIFGRDAELTDSGTLDQGRTQFVIGDDAKVRK